MPIAGFIYLKGEMNLTKEQTERIKELEAEYAEFLSDAKSLDEKKAKCQDAVRTVVFDQFSNKEYWKYCVQNFPKINELYDLYEKFLYDPSEDEEVLSYLLKDGMTKEEKLKALSDAYWSAANSGYCDAMANRLMAGQRDSMTDWWEKNCSNQAVIDRYFNWLKEQDG